jgi:predicted PurR-regulated permease PerM
MSTRQVFTSTLAVLAGLATGYILLTSLRMLIVLLIAIIIASAVRPMIERLVLLRIPTGAAVPLIYAGITLFVVILSFAVLPPIINQFADYLQNDWRLANRIIVTKNWMETNLSRLTGDAVVIGDDESIRTTTSQLVEEIRSTGPELLNDVGGLLGELVLVIVMGVYWLGAREKSIDFVTRLVPPRYRENTNEALREIEVSMGTYTRGIVFVALFVGFANFLILLLLRVPNAATYAFIIGVTTMLPVIGGFIGGGTATLLALLGSPLHGLAVFGTFVAVQQIEVHYLTPRTMSRSVGVDPLLVMVAVFVGFALYGVIGAVISVPVLGTINVLLREFVIEPRKEEVAPYSLEGGVPIFKVGDTPVTPVEPVTPLITENLKL